MSETHQEQKKELSFNRRWAKFWGISVRTITEWKGLGVKVNKVESVAQFAATRTRVPEPVLRKLAELRGDQKEILPGVAEGTRQVQEDPEWLAYRQNRPAGEGGAAETLEDFLAFYTMKLRRSMQLVPPDPAETKFLSDQVIKFDRAVREHQLLADKLGLESGESISKGEAERWFRAWGFWTMRELDATLATACPKIAGLAPGLTVEGVRAVLEPELLEARMLRSFVQATKVESPLTLPAWVVETVKDTVDDYLENGRAEFQLASVPDSRTVLEVPTEVPSGGVGEKQCN